jgi:hypothetical protein
MPEPHTRAQLADAAAALADHIAVLICRRHRAAACGKGSDSSSKTSSVAAAEA